MGKFKVLKVELNSEAVRELLQSSAMKNCCEQLARGIASRAGEGYQVSTYTGRTRVNASVHAETKAAKRDNLKNNTLLKAVKG